MRRLYLIRHGLPEFPGGERMCIGTTDLPLSEEGFRQAEAMARVLPPVTAVFSSPLTRCRQTAAVLNMPVTVLDDLRELHAGVWDGLTFTQIRKDFSELYAARGIDSAIPIPGSEDVAAGAERFRRALITALESSSGDIAVIAHGGIVACFFRAAGLLPRKPDYTEILTLYWDTGKFCLQEEHCYATTAENDG